MFALAAIRRLGEATRDDVARELGVHCIFRTLVRLEADGKIVGEERWNSTLGRKQRVFSLPKQELAA